MMTISQTTLRGHSARLQFLTAIAAAIILVILGTILLDMANRYIPPQRIASPLVTPTDAPTIAGCQPSDASDTQGTSVRLAGEAETLLEGDAPDTELATLLSICALQTAYSMEADMALQRAMSAKDAVPTFEGHRWYMWGLVFSPDGQTLYTAGADPTVQAWNVQTREELRTFHVAEGGGSRLSLSPDGRYLLIGPPHGGARLMDAQNGEILRTFGRAAGGGMEFSPDGNYVLTSGMTGPTALFDVATGEEARTFAMEGWGTLSPDGRFVATVDACVNSGCPQAISIYDLESGELLRSFEPDVATLWIMAFSHDGRYLITAEDTGQHLNADNSVVEMPAAVQLWDVETGTVARRFEGHTGMPSSVTFSPDDRYVLTAAYDGTTRVWDTETGEPVRIFAPDHGEATTANFSPDGRHLVIGYEDATVALWHTDVHDFITDACAKVSRDFMLEERTQYGLSDGVPTCPQFGENAILPLGMTPIPTQPIPVWTPLPTAASS
jgi:WD40 repeat protein